MIDHKYKFIFIHVPKTGGTSIESIFNDSIKLKKLKGPSDGNDFAGKHKRATTLRKEHPEEFDSYFKFSIVRNPWDQEVSAHVFHKKIKINNLSFKERVIKRHLSDRSLLKPSNMLFDDDGNNLMDFIGRFENLQEDFNFICDKIQVPRKQLPYINKVKRDHYSNFYDEETKNIIAESYSKEIEYFGYKFEN